MLKRTLIALFAIIILASASQAVPNLQIYIPGADYNTTTQTWSTSETNFEIWVIAAKLDHGAIYDINLVAALAGPNSQFDGTPTDGALSITDESSNTTNFDAADFTYGTPPSSDPMPGHGIYPTNYASLLVAPVTTSGPYVPVQDFVPGGDGGTSLYGQIFKYTVSTTYEYLHFDAYGFYDDPDGRRIFAPLSHDGETAVPEPTTLLLMGLGLGGAALVRRIKK